jgi:hypothetical protein
VIRDRALALLAHHSKEDVVAILRQETGKEITKQAVAIWASAETRKQQGQFDHLVTNHLTPRQKVNLEAQEARVRQQVASLPRRCGICLGISAGETCRHCGSPR